MKLKRKRKRERFGGCELESAPSLGLVDSCTVEIWEVDVIREGRPCNRSRLDCVRLRGDQAYLSAIALISSIDHHNSATTFVYTTCLETVFTIV